MTEPSGIERAVAEARRIHRLYGVRAPAEIDIEAFAADHGLYSIPRRLVGYDGNIVRRGDRALVGLDEAVMGTPRGRFTLAHELAHFLLHRGRTIAALCQASAVDRPGEVYQEERQANACATELLMSESLFAPHCGDGEVSFARVAAIASLFTTSLTATCIRFVELTTVPCAWARSRGGTITRWDGSNSFPIKLAKRFELGDGAHAKNAAGLEAHSARGGAERVPGEAWARLTKKAKGVELWEESVPMGPHGDVLTLLFCASAG